MPRPTTQRVVFQPSTYQGLQRGINQIVAAIRPTLGPLPRSVAITLEGKRDTSPEILHDGGLIARRIVALPDRDADMGAMYLRQLLWSLHEQTGDGTATAAVLFQAVFNHGLRYLVAGGNAMRLRRYLEEGMQVILADLDGMAVKVEGKEKLAHIAESICYDPPLSKMLGEIMDIIGEYGRLEIRKGRGRDLDREYVEGLYWEDSGLLSRQMITDWSALRTELHNPAILISDLDLKAAQDLVPVLERVNQAGITQLVMMARTMSENVLGLLDTVNQDPAKFHVIAVKTPKNIPAVQAQIMQDLSMLVGGRPVIQAAGQHIRDVQVEELGRARRAWAGLHNFGIIGGRGQPRRLRQHIAALRLAFQRADTQSQRNELQTRIGKLLGGSATLLIGAATEIEMETRHQLAKRTASAMRAAISGGVLPGGGVALLNCRPSIQARLAGCQDADERAAYKILLKALEVPARTIISNAGFDSSEVLAEIKLAGPNFGFDVRQAKVVELDQVGIMDVAGVHKAAVSRSILSAALALTVDVLVHKERPEMSSEP